MNNDTVNVTIIGFGEMGKRRALEYQTATFGKMIFSAVVEPNDRRYKEGCEWVGYTPNRYTNISEMLAKENLDALIIASQNCFHLDNIKECLNTNLPIMLEKPLESSFDKICDLVRVTQSYSQPIMVDHVMRYAPIINKAKALIDAGKIGKVCSFNFTQYHGGHSMFTTYRRTIEDSGGQLIEKATHDLDIAFFLCGAAPKQVKGVCRL
ncbi:MAG: Gfo/Idh/MocA family oxidoreductase [Lentisphaerae bacterium]|nr:Gfo/Idh/MocA family oxidoreductase [Lentisphaerota bacterium]MCP4100521.1 Gfo/Idh/MocA family oxidoreductase [Lentisphaerota bacterium]